MIDMQHGKHLDIKNEGREKGQRKIFQRDHRVADDQVVYVHHHEPCDDVYRGGIQVQQEAFLQRAVPVPAEDQPPPGRQARPIDAESTATDISHVGATFLESAVGTARISPWHANTRK